MDAYLRRFETFARSQQWEEVKWAIGLSTLLKGKALEVFARLAPEQALSYAEIKAALLQRFDYTEDGFRKRFRDCGVESSETFVQFVMRIENYLTRWIEMAKCDRTFGELADLILREQLLSGCTLDLALFLRERKPANVHQMAELADRFVEARSGKAKAFTLKPTSQGNKLTKPGQSSSGGGGKLVTQSKGVNHDRGQGYGTKQTRDARRCFKCDSPYHLAAKWPQTTVKGKVAVGTDISGNEGRHNTDQIVCDQMPVVKGRVGDQDVAVLRDTGCSGIVVRRDLVNDNELLNMMQTCKLVDGREISVPIAQVRLDTPYYSGTANVWCMNCPLYDVIIGNVPGARDSDKPDPNWKESGGDIGAVQTREQRKREDIKTPLTVPAALKDVTTPDELGDAQKADKSLRALYDLVDKGNVKRTVTGTTSRFYIRKGLLFRECTDETCVCKQLVVPEDHRETVLRLAHDSVMAGHMGIARTTDRVLAEFFWPGCRADIERYCKSCDACQKTVHKGRIKKAPLGDMPIIDRPFERVAVDIIGPLIPASDRGHRYILTVVDFATRYPEATPLKRIETEDVAEALLKIFSRVGVPKEILSDRGSQFTSALMQEFSRILSLRTP
ncbi:uncharacterized protein LOC110442615 [Mizuhopecten yessoensis]|uniref:uncharacterized protein LOC110442615 n=1 Tax=Mizuhopecten yessoensis TaxID=6573 RepID=UPI000B45B859|nr:uncharacterized protein LOC110442615 [Mizuhopecten yessoensis]